MGSGADGPCHRSIDGEHHRYAPECRGHSRCTVNRRSVDLASTKAVSEVHGKNLIKAYSACLAKLDVGGQRRRYHQETDAMVAAKAEAAWHCGLSTIICIGETQSERRDGTALSVCGAQIAGSVPKEVAQSGAAAIAYEPLWAIGNGHVPTPAEIAEVHVHIRSCLIALAGPDDADIHILYGGSVTSANAAAILGSRDVGGALIGGASLKSADFDAVLRTLPGRA